MEISGSFGYKIGRKLRLMRITEHADLLWQVLVREIYVLIKHYQTIESLQLQFENLKEAKNKPKKDTIEKCEPFTEHYTINLSLQDDKYSINSWDNLLRFCQMSYINVLESGYFLNNGDEKGPTFIIDFNRKEVILYSKDSNNKIKEYNKATLNEIMEFDEMPTKTLTEIVEKMNENHCIYKIKLENIHSEQKKIQIVIEKAKELGHDQNILEKAKKIHEDLIWEEKMLKSKRRLFYHRLDELNFIEHET